MRWLVYSQETKRDKCSGSAHLLLLSSGPQPTGWSYCTQGGSPSSVSSSEDAFVDMLSMCFHGNSKSSQVNNGDEPSRCPKELKVVLMALLLIRAKGGSDPYVY